MVIRLVLSGVLLWNVSGACADQSHKPTLTYDEHEQHWHLSASSNKMGEYPHYAELFETPAAVYKSCRYEYAIDGVYAIERLPASLLKTLRDDPRWELLTAEQQRSILDKAKEKIANPEWEWELDLYISIRCLPKDLFVDIAKDADLKFPFAWSEGELLTVIYDDGPAPFMNDDPKVSTIGRFIRIKLPFKTFQGWVTKGQGQIKLNHIHHSPIYGTIVTIHNNYIQELWATMQRATQY